MWTWKILKVYSMLETNFKFRLKMEKLVVLVGSTIPLGCVDELSNRVHQKPMSTNGDETDEQFLLKK